MVYVKVKPCDGSCCHALKKKKKKKKIVLEAFPLGLIFTGQPGQFHQAA